MVRRFLVVALVAAACTTLQLASSEEAATIPLQNHDFGNVAVGSSSAIYTYTISPAGSGAQSDRVESVTPLDGCDDFSVDAQGLPTDVSNDCDVQGSGSDQPQLGTPNCTAVTYKFHTSYHPSFAANEACVVAVVIDGSTQYVTLLGKGMEPPIRLVVAPPSLDFGQVLVGTSSNQAGVTLTNFGSDINGVDVMSVTLDDVSKANGVFTISSGTVTDHKLGANGAVDRYGITCKATSQGQFNGTLIINTAVPATPTTVALSCTGIMSNLQFLDATGMNVASPITMTGNQAGGATRVAEPIDVTITLKNLNSSTAPVTIHNLTVTSAQLQLINPPLPEKTLAIGASTTVTVRYLAGVAHQQGPVGDLVASIDNGLTRQTTVMAAAVPTAMSVTPDGTVDFGPICANSQASQDFLVVKSSIGAFQLQSVSTPDAPFTISGAPSNVAVNSNAGTANFTITASPTAAGAFSSPVQIVTDIPGAAPHMLQVVAQGLPPGITPTPAALDLGVADLDTTSIGQMVTLTNCDAQPLTLTDLRIVGRDPHDFAVVVAPTSTTISPASSAQYVVVMQAHENGVRSATLEIDHQNGVVEVPLTGTGTNGADTTADGATYYTCSTGRGAASWPILAALAMLIRRRRR